MKRTQLYLDEEMARALKTLSRQKGMTVSELVRTGLHERYMLGKDLDKAALARSVAGIWKNRDDLKDIDASVRKLRKGSRQEKLHRQKSELYLECGGLPPPSKAQASLRTPS